MNANSAHQSVFGKPGRSKKYRPNDHCHGYVLTSRHLDEQIWVKSIYGEEHVKDVCHIVLNINDVPETYQQLSSILDRVSDIQPVGTDVNECKSVSTIDLDYLRVEARCLEVQDLVFDPAFIFSGYADFMNQEDIWKESMRYFHQKK